MRRRLVRLLGLLLAVGAFLYLFIFRVGWDELVATLSIFDARHALPVLLGQALFHLLGGVALWVLALSFRRIALGKLLHAYWRCLAIGHWTPATVGEASFAWLVGSAGISLREGLALVTVDKIVTLAATCLLAVPALWMVIPLSPEGLRIPAGAWWLVASLVIAALGVSAWLRVSPRGERIARMLTEYLRLLDQLGRRSLGLLASNALLTVIRTATAAGVLWWAIAGFEIILELSFLQFLVLVSLARLLALVVPTPNGLGIFEVALVELIGGGPAVAPAVLSGALVARLAALLVVTVGLFAPARSAAAGRIVS